LFFCPHLSAKQSLKSLTKVVKQLEHSVVILAAARHDSINDVDGYVMFADLKQSFKPADPKFPISA
jgi:divalent metal cation (Fe/Co/Zn/Cd) transporter